MSAADMTTRHTAHLEAQLSAVDAFAETIACESMLVLDHYPPIPGNEELRAVATGRLCAARELISTLIDAASASPDDLQPDKPNL